MRRETQVKLGALVMMVLLIAASGALSVEISSSAGRHKLTYTDDAAEGAPEEVALGVAMGAFRGLFVNYLWIRASKAKEDGDYYEAVDLAKMITYLQPRFPRVWTFHAWNLAYNISVTTQTPQERWNWVRAGIQLLRQRGIPANPNSILLHKELAWIHMHKVQGFMDDANHYYKRRQAEEWTVVLSPPPVADQRAIREVDRIRRDRWISERRANGDDVTAETEGAFEGFEPTSAKHVFAELWLRDLAEARDTLSDIALDHPEVYELVDRLEREADIGLFERTSADYNKLLDRVERTRSLFVTGDRLNMQFDTRGDPLWAILTDTTYGEAGPALMRFVRKRELIDQYGMEPERMIRYTERFGPLDWRHAAAHAVYWSARGVEEAGLRKTALNWQDFNSTNTDRLTMQSMQELFRSGTIVYDINNEDFFTSMPNIEFLDAYGEVIEELRERSEFDFGANDISPGRKTSFYTTGYVNFMKDAVRYLYRRGETEKAYEYRKRIIEYNEQNLIRNPVEELDMVLPLEEWVAARIKNDERYTTPYVAVQEVQGTLVDAYVNGLLVGNRDVFNDAMEYARVFHKKFSDKQVFQVPANWGIPERMNFMMRDFDMYAAMLLAMQVQQIGFPNGPLMYSSAPIDLQARAYVFMERIGTKDQVNAAHERGMGPSFEEMFPEAPGTELYRAQIAQLWDAPEGATEIERK